MGLKFKIIFDGAVSGLSNFFFSSIIGMVLCFLSFIAFSPLISLIVLYILFLKTDFMFSLTSLS